MIRPPTTPPLLLLPLLILINLSAAAAFAFTTYIAAATTRGESTFKFREAPQFYNSPECPVISSSDEEENKGKQQQLDQSLFMCSDKSLHIAMTLDHTYIRGSMAAVLSVLKHTSCPQNTFFHFVVSVSDHQYPSSSSSSSLHSIVSSTFPYLRFRLYPFVAEAAVSRLISTSIRSALDCPLNYARSYLATLLPLCVSRVLYLDSDVILFDDVSSLLFTNHLSDDDDDDLSSSSTTTTSAVLAAPEYCNANFSYYFTHAFWSHPTLSLTFASRRRPPCYFNTGVMVIDLSAWRRGNYTRRIEEWMELQKTLRIYELGSLPPFLLVFAGEINPVDHRWNQHGLGGDNFRGLCRNLHPGPVSLLHWSGKGKPWVRLDARRPCPLDALWAPYDLLHTSPYSSLTD